MFKKSLYRKFLITAIFLTGAPIIVFILEFFNQDISENISDWASFGSYIGGILTPIISILSLIVLGYITYLISKNSNEENKNLFIFQKKIEAYEEFIKLIPKMNIIPARLHQFIDSIYRNFSTENMESIEINLPEMQEIYKGVSFYSEFYYFILHFNVRYGHLFDYDFKSKDYINLVDSSREIKEVYSELYNDLITGNFDDLKLELNEPLKKQSESLVNFINGLRKEL